MIVDVPYLLVGQGIPPQKRTSHSCLVADQLPIEIREVSDEDAPLALEVSATVSEKGGGERAVVLGYRWHDDAMWVRSSEIIELVPESRGNFGFGAVHRVPDFPETVADLKDGAALAVFERRRSVVGGWAAPLFMMEGLDDVPKKRSTVYRTRAEFDAVVASYRDYRISEATEKAIDAAKQAAKKIIAVDGSYYRRVQMPQLVVDRVRVNGQVRVRVTHQPEALKGQMTWPVTQFDAMATSWRAAGNDAALTAPSMTIHRPDLFARPDERLQRMQKAATLIERQMGDKLKRGDARFFEAFASLRDEIERDGSVEALQDAMASAWSTLRDYPQFGIDMSKVGVYERVDEAFGDRLRRIASDGLVPEGDLEALSSVGFRLA